MLQKDGVKVVYWIGAGASANALPIVGEMPTAFMVQHQWIKRPERDSATRDKLEAYFRYMAKLATQAKSFGTVDTYARALYLQNEYDELARLKLHMAIFFLLEQVAAFERNAPAGDKYEAYQKNALIDTRYMSWLALLLENGRKLTERVQVISWNYDLQIEHALGKYLKLDALSRLHGPEQIYVHPGYASAASGRMPFLIHLNGIAGQTMDESLTDCLYDGLAYNDPLAVVKKIMAFYMDEHGLRPKALASVTKAFTFAWERQPIAEQGIALAKAALQEARVLVIIGYSFPSFNRVIDKELYKAFRNELIGAKYIVLQSRTISADTLRSMLGIRESTPKIIQVDDLSQFHIPTELF